MNSRFDTATQLTIVTAIKNYHQSHNSIRTTDMMMCFLAGGAAVSLLSLSFWAVIILGGTDAGVKYFVRDNKTPAYQQSLKQLIDIYTELLKTKGAEVTAEPLFLEILDIIKHLLPCTSIDEREQAKAILLPDILRTPDAFPLLSKNFKDSLLHSPLSLDLIPPPPLSKLAQIANAASNLLSMGSSEAKLPEAKSPGTTTNNQASSQWVKKLHPSHLWCTFYGYNPKALDAQTSRSVQQFIADAASSVTKFAINKGAAK